MAGIRARTATSGTDAVFVGYPKTGNTWVRFLVGAYVARLIGAEEPLLFDEPPSLLPRPRGPVPRYRFTHDPLRWERQTAGDLRHANVTWPFQRRLVVLLVRHPLDVLVSNWHHCRNRTPHLFEGDLSAFVDDPVFGLEKFLTFYALWAARMRPMIHVLRFEDLSERPAEAVEELIGAVRLRYDERIAREAIAASSFEEMQRLERADPSLTYADGSAVFSPGLADGEPAHVRRGVVGGYRDELPSLRIAEWEDEVRRMPARFAYS